MIRKKKKKHWKLAKPDSLVNNKSPAFRYVYYDFYLFIETKKKNGQHDSTHQEKLQFHEICVHFHLKSKKKFTTIRVLRRVLCNEIMFFYFFTCRCAYFD